MEDNDEFVCDGEIRGAYFFQKASIDRAWAIKKGARLFLEREPYNAYDPNAIIVRDMHDMLPIGYIAKEKASIIAPLIDVGNLVLAAIKHEATSHYRQPRPIFVAWLDNTGEVSSTSANEERKHEKEAVS